MSEISRRAMLKGAPAIAAAAIGAVTVPAVAADLYGLPLAAQHIEQAVEAMADPRVMGHWSVTIHSGDAEQYWGFRQTFDEVARAIAAHERARAALEAAIDREDEIEDRLDAHPTYIRYPKVQYARLIIGTTDDGEKQYSPLYARSLAELDSECETECDNRRIFWGAPGVERVKARYAELRRDLRQQMRSKAAIEGAAGLGKAERETKALNAALERATIAVMVARPQNEAQRARKADYMMGKCHFDADWWDAEALLAALRSNLQLGA